MRGPCLRPGGGAPARAVALPRAGCRAASRVPRLVRRRSRGCARRAEGLGIPLRLDGRRAFRARGRRRLRMGQLRRRVARDDRGRGGPRALRGAGERLHRARRDGARVGVDRQPVEHAAGSRMAPVVRPPGARAVCARRRRLGGSGASAPSSRRGGRAGAGGASARDGGEPFLDASQRAAASGGGGARRTRPRAANADGVGGPRAASRGLSLWTRHAVP